MTSTSVRSILIISAVLMLAGIIIYTGAQGNIVVGYGGSSFCKTTFSNQQVACITSPLAPNNCLGIPLNADAIYDGPFNCGISVSAMICGFLASVLTFVMAFKRIRVIGLINAAFITYVTIVLGFYALLFGQTGFHNNGDYVYFLANDGVLVNSPRSNEQASFAGCVVVLVAAFLYQVGNSFDTEE